MPGEDEEREEEEQSEDDEKEDDDNDGDKGDDGSSEGGGSPYGSYESSLADDDRDFDFEPDETAQKGLKDFMKTAKNIVRCRYSTLEEGEQENDEEENDEEETEPSAKKRKTEGGQKRLGELQSVVKTTERLQLACHPDRREEKLHVGVGKAIGESLRHRLTVLRVDNFAGSGDPIFGTRYELRRKYYALDHDLFELLTATFVSGGKCGLKKLTLSRGFMSAESFMKFLRVTKPPLESFRCRCCLFHGRNFEPLIKSLKASTTAPNGLLEFEMNAAVGGKDPWGLLADSFPNLQMLRANRIFGETPARAGLDRLKSLVKKKCRFPKADEKLSANCEITDGVVEIFATSDHHDDSYRGQGLFWDDLRNTSECMECWEVGQPVKKEEILAFFLECGISYDSSIEVEKPECGMCDREDEDMEVIALQVAVEKLAEGLVTVKGTTLAGREIAAITALDPATTLVRTVVEELAQKYPCNCMALRLALPGGSTVDVLNKGSETLASVLK